MRIILALMAGLAIWVLAPATQALALGCFPLAQTPGTIIQASIARTDDAWVQFHKAALPSGATLQIDYLGHSSFFIQTAEGATAITDYNGYLRATVTPDVVTMNNAHSGHFTPSPDPQIEHVLRGWNPDGGMAEHDIIVKDMRVRNIPTSVHGRVGAQANSNSIFVFEIEDLCVAHLGHLHHKLLDVHLGELGVIDILMVPIDGAYTMSQPEMVQVVEQIKPAVIIPMHYFGPTVLNRFLGLLDQSWEIEIMSTPSVHLSRATLPTRKVIVLPGS